MAKQIKTEEIGSHIINVKRVASYYEEQQNRFTSNQLGKEAKAPMFQNNVLYKSASLKQYGGGSVNLGMSIEETKKVFEQIFVKDSKDISLEEIQKWYKAQQIAIPINGLQLEIGKNEAGEYINPVHYVWYQILKTGRNTCTNQAELNSNHNVIIIDSVQLENSEAKQLKLKNQAVIEFNAKISETDIETLRKYLFIFKGKGIKELQKVNLNTLKHNMYYTTLGNLVNSYPEMFLEILEDKDASLKYDIERLIDKGIFVRQSGNIVYVEGNEPLGTMSAAIVWMKDKSNDQLVKQLQAKLTYVG